MAGKVMIKNTAKANIAIIDDIDPVGSRATADIFTYQLYSARRLLFDVSTGYS